MLPSLLKRKKRVESLRISQDEVVNISVGGYVDTALVWMDATVLACYVYYNPLIWVFPKIVV